MSPFDPSGQSSQFALLMGYATTTLSLVVVSNRLRDSRRGIEGILEPSRTPGQKRLSSRLPWFIGFSDWLAFFQLLMLGAVAWRIVWSTYGQVSLVYDGFLAIATFINFAVFWIILFIIVTWGHAIMEKFEKKRQK